MVFARTHSAEIHLAQQFRQHTTARRYLAIAYGDIKEQTIETRLVRDRGDGRRGSTPLPNAGKKSKTHFKPLEIFGEYTLVECRPETGARIKSASISPRGAIRFAARKSICNRSSAPL